VNRTFVRQFLGERTPLQTRIAFGFPKADWAHAATIVGVVDDVRSEAPGVAPKPTVYAPNTQRGYPTLQQTIVVWTPRGDMTALTERVRDTLLSFDRGLVMRVTPAKDIVTAATRSERLGMALMAAFGTVALVLAAVGVYGVIAYIGSTRRMEMATRLALGAPRAEVLRLMLTTARRVSLAGTALGVGLAYAGGRVLAGRVFGVSAVDGVVLGGSALLVLTVVFIATLVPAVRMSRADPIRALRAE
jgi:ABC-type antimicrobial peptide transport system permease subunit